MTIQIKELDVKDYNVARKFSIEGMGVRHYTNVEYVIYLYSKYFFFQNL